MLSREQKSSRHTLARRSFLSGLASLPLIGGGVALIGQPSAAAVPVTDELMQSYKAWLFMEHRMVSSELAGHDRMVADQVESFFMSDTPGFNWHPQWAGGRASWIDAPQPSTRAAVVLSAVGVPLV